MGSRLRITPQGVYFYLLDTAPSDKHSGVTQVTYVFRCSKAHWQVIWEDRGLSHHELCDVFREVTVHLHPHFRPHEIKMKSPTRAAMHLKYLEQRGLWVAPDGLTVHLSPEVGGFPVSKIPPHRRRIGATRLNDYTRANYGVELAKEWIDE